MCEEVKQPQQIWLTTDTHFGHANMIKLCHRPEDFEKRIIDNWYQVVRPEDIVIHLGDVTWHVKDYLDNVVAKLPGKKILVRGNHDEKSLMYYMKHGFDLAVDSLSMKYRGLDILFTHEPKIFHEHDINIHGHLHTNTLELSEPYSLYYLISLENNGYTMTNLDALVRHKLQKMVYDFKNEQEKYLEGDTESKEV